MNALRCDHKHTGPAEVNGLAGRVSADIFVPKVGAAERLGPDG